MDDHRLPMWSVIFLCFVTTNLVSAFNLTVLHTNDFHGRIQEINKYSGRCTNSSAAKGECYGGSARLKTKIDELRKKYPNSLLLDGGDQYQGSLLFYVNRGEIMAHFMNILGYDAMALGNHEFDMGPQGTKPLIDNATFPILSCNIDINGFPDLVGVQKSFVKKISGESVGIVGYTTTETPIVSNPGGVKFNDEIKSIQVEVDKLTKQGVNKIIALGHAGYAKDMEIAKEVSGVDVVVGGHTNTFLYTGDRPSIEEPLGPYPTVIRNKEGKNVLVVQDYAYGKYLGFLQVDFDGSGTVTAWNGNPILMDNKVPKDSQVTKLIQGYLPGVEKIKNEQVGNSSVHLQGDRSVCRVQECNMGNLITDAIIRQSLRYTDSSEWNHVAIALIQGGGIRSSINQGDIVVSDVLNVQPFGNTIDLVELTGQVLWDALEHSAAHWVPKGELFGGFLQMSGLKVVYNMKKKAGNRVVMAEARCADCAIPEFFPLNMTKSYKVMMPSFTIKGGDGYTMIRDNVGKSHVIGDVDSRLTLNYIRKNSPITSGLEGRIKFVDDSDDSPACVDGASIEKGSLFVLLITFLYFLISL